MKEYIFITVLICAILLFTAFYIKYRKKHKDFERSLPNDVVKTRMNISNRSQYIDKNNCTTIILNIVPWKLYYVKDFVYERTLIIGNSTFLFDLSRKKCALFKDIAKQNTISTRPFEQYKSIELFEEAKTKTVTRGGISPIAINGYRIASVSKRSEKPITRIYFVFTCIADGKEWKHELDVYNGLLYSTSSSYASKLKKADSFMKDFSHYTGCKVGA